MGGFLEITEIVEVDRNPDAVWALFQDVPALTQCLSGAELTEDRGDGSYAGRITVKLGPMTATFEGEADVDSNAVDRSGVVTGNGADRSGGSMGQVRIAYVVEAQGAGTRIAVDADVVLSGAVAQFGRTGLIKEVSKRLIGEFVNCVEAKLAAETPEEASAVTAADVGGLSLFFSSLWATIAGFFKELTRRK